MKKTILVFLLAFTVVMPQFSQAATLDNLMAKIELLQREVNELKNQLKGQVTGGAPGGFATPLKRGSTGPEVIALQNFLSEKGFYSGTVDGTFGLATLNSLNAYKNSIGFTSFGSSFGGSWRVIGDPVTMYTITTSSCKADFDGNGKVEVADYELLQDNFTTSPQDSQLMFDIKVDGIVDKYDVKEWMTQYGKTNFCMSSNTTTAQWLASIAGTPTNPPAASPTPAGSNWSTEIAGATSDNAWLWDYQVKKITTYTRRQIPVTVTGSNTSDLMWVTEPSTSMNVTLLGQQFAGIYDSVELNAGKLYLVQNANFTSYNGYQYEIVRKLELYKPTASENQTTSIDMAYEKVGNKLQGTIYINKKPISSYNGVYPKFFTYFANDAKWMMTLRILNDGPIENSSILGVANNAPEAGYNFETIGDSRLSEINIVESATFAPTTQQDYYNPTTNTITLESDKGQVIWFHLFSKPPAVFPTGFIGASESKTHAASYAINLQRNAAVIVNGDFVPLAEQGN